MLVKSNERMSVRACICVVCVCVCVNYVLKCMLYRIVFILRILAEAFAYDEEGVVSTSALIPIFTDGWQ